MHTETETPTPRPDHRPCIVEIKVNRKPVTLHGRRATGLQIKEAAIDQGVPIHFDFVLFLILGPGQRKVIGHDDCVTLRKNSCFEAIPCDDNS